MPDSERKPILLLGAAGQVGRELAPRLATLGEVVPLTRAECDLSDLAAVERKLEETAPGIIVNAAAWTAVDAAESEPEAAGRLNEELPTLLARYAADNDALLVDYSTDYVFDGEQKAPWKEADHTAPINRYGATKLAGLRAIQRSRCRHLVLRVTWIYGDGERNFPATMRRLATERDELAVVCDQVGSPTPADWLAEMTVKALEQVLADPDKAGLYHLAPAGSTSWHGFAQEVIAGAREAGEPVRIEPENIRAITTAEYPTPAARPANSRLDSARFAETFGIHPPHWRTLYRQRASKQNNEAP